jgi:biotin carboxyl carrier protein
MIVTVEGTSFDVQIESARPPVYRVRVDGRTETVHCVTDGASVHVFWRGRGYRIDPPRKPLAGSGIAEGSLASPMPGRVIDVHVLAGDRVSAGQPLVVIEAMKMETVLRAPRDGVVQRVSVRSGDRITAGQPLVDLA